jgi:diguanylate cyclase (GGDEF)-like protein/PAS domain S-box-containing protein
VLLLALGTLTMLVFDVAYTLIQLNDGWQTGSVLDLGWIAFYVTCGAAALHPSMVLLTRPVAPRHAGIAPGRLGLLSLASLVAPGVLLLEAIQDDVRHAGVIAIFSAALFLLVLARLSGVVATHRQGVARERELRMAVASLVAATSIEQIARAVRGAAARLFGEETKHTVVLVVGDGDELHPVRADPTEPAWRIRQPHEAHEAWLPVLLGEVRLVPADDLGPDLATGLDGMPSALLCPLALRYRPSGDPLVGALVIVADEHDLARLRDTLETLAAQAALGVERVMLNEELNRRNSEAYFRTLVQNASDVIMILDDEDRVSYASPSATSMFGHKPLEGEGLTELVSPQDRARVGAALESMRSSAEQHRRGDWRVTRSDGTTVELEARCSNLRRDPTVQGMVLTLRDVTDQRRLERELKHRAFHDSLTGLANRVLFQDRVEHALARARGKTAVVGVLFVDLDDFKVVNDTMGHGVGDELLVAVARRLSATVRAHDTAARLGGDEFAVLVEDATRPADVEVLAEHVVKAFAEPFRLSTGPVSVAASVGVATAMDSADADELLRHADLALYAAKGTGKSRWRRYQPSLHTGMVERHELRSGLDEAIAEATFTLRHQPIVELATGVVVGFEALLRWPHPQRGMVMPEAFIALAEETAHIVPLGAWVLEHALADAARWQHLTTPPRPLHIGVNVSARQFRDPGFVTSVQHALRTSGLDPALVMLELTESLLMRHDDRIGRDLHTLKDLGVHIAIDDFGTGYSSLSYLRQFPIDVLKIDKSFIDGMADSPRQTALVEAIIRIAHTLELQAVAEGIETQTQRDLLATIGCPLGQGFLFSHPLPADETEKLLRGQTRLGVPLGEPGPDEVRGRAG